MPVPWLVGSLLVMAGLNVSGYEVSARRGGRQAGQVVIGVAIGLYVSPAVARELGSHLGLMAAAGLVAILWGPVAARLLARLAGVDRTTALFPSVPGGMSEMSILGDRFGADPAPIAMVQSIRMLRVAVLVPGAIILAGASGTSLYEPPGVDEWWPGVAAMLAAGAAAGWVFARARVNLAWLLGPMLVGILFAVTEHTLSTVPKPLSAAAQVLIACALGARFRRSFLLACRRLALAALATNLILLAVSVAFGIVVARLAGLSTPAIVLATAPGGLPGGVDHGEDPPPRGAARGGIPPGPARPDRPPRGADLPRHAGAGACAQPRAGRPRGGRGDRRGRLSLRREQRLRGPRRRALRPLRAAISWRGRTGRSSESIRTSSPGPRSPTTSTCSSWGGTGSRATGASSTRRTVRRSPSG